MRIHDKIRHILETTPGLTQKGLADRMGLNPAAVNRMLYGRRNIMAEEIPVIEAYIGSPIEISSPVAGEYIQTKNLSNRGLSDVAQQRVTGQINSSGHTGLPPVPVYSYSDKGLVLADWADRHPAQAGLSQAMAVYAAAGEMEPRYFSGEVVYLHPSRPPQSGRDGFVELSGGHMFLCRIQSLTEAQLEAQFFNPPAVKKIDRKDIAALYSVIGRG